MAGNRRHRRWPPRLDPQILLRDLAGRVVVSHDDWGVVHSASGRHLTLWGSIRFATELRMLPTYRQLADSPGFGKGADAARAVSDYQPQRINKSIELLERGQPIYYDASTGGYEEGMRMASTWGDYTIYNVEHVALDFAALREFMRGLADAGPPASSPVASCRPSPRPDHPERPLDAHRHLLRKRYSTGR